MKDKKLVIKCVELLGLEWREINCNTIAVLINGNWVIYNPFIPENAHQTNELIEKMEINVLSYDDDYDNADKVWTVFTARFKYYEEKDRNIAIYKCIAAYFGEEFNSETKEKIL